VQTLYFPVPVEMRTLLHVDFFVLSGTTVWNQDIVVMVTAVPLKIFIDEIIHAHRV
jgi:hypothetical protein